MAEREITKLHPRTVAIRGYVAATIECEKVLKTNRAGGYHDDRRINEALDKKDVALVNLDIAIRGYADV